MPEEHRFAHGCQQVEGSEEGVLEVEGPDHFETALETVELVEKASKTYSLFFCEAMSCSPQVELEAQVDRRIKKTNLGPRAFIHLEEAFFFHLLVAVLHDDADDGVDEGLVVLVTSNTVSGGSHPSIDRGCTAEGRRR